MQKRVWTYRRKGIPAVWVGWYAEGHRRAKSFDNTALAERYASTKRDQLSAGVSGEIVALDWPELVAEYQRSKDAGDGLRESSLYETLLTLRHFERLIGPVRSTQITQAILERFVKAREDDSPMYNGRESNGKRISLATLNKDIRNIKTFVRWCVEWKYLSPDMRPKLKPRRVQQAPVVTLSPDQVKVLLIAAAAESPAWYVRVLLAVSTGLRRGDIEALQPCDIHLDRGTIATTSRKTGKAMGERPVPEGVMVKLAEYLGTLNGRLFADTYTAKKWQRIRTAAGLPTLKFHDLRKVFASVLALHGVSTATIQRLLEHAVAKTTTGYISTDAITQDAVNRLPVSDWLR